jgi:DNA polymerase-3 subunit delta
LATIDYQQILKSIKEKDIKPFYFLSGGEPYFIDLISNYIESSVLDESEKAFNQTIAYGKDIKWEELVESLKRFPMLAERQVVILKEAQSIPRITEKLMPYLDQIVNTTIFVVCYKYKTTEAKKFIEKAKSKGVYYVSKPLYDNQIPDWIHNYLARKGFKITQKASLLLTEYLGSNLSTVANELHKLTIALEKGTEINTEDIEDNVGISKDYNIFELQDALANKDILKVNRIVNYYGDNPKSHPMVMTISSLYGFYGRLIGFHYLPHKSQDEAMQSIGMSFYAAKNLLRTAQQIGPGRCYKALKLLREYDQRSKGINNASASDGSLLKELAFKLLH